MKNYIVTRPEVYQQSLHVIAKNAKEALAKAMNEDLAEPIKDEDLAYDYTIDDETQWNVFEEK